MDSVDHSRGWSGSRFVPVNKRGFGMQIQVCNFSNRNAAWQFARMSGFEVEKADATED